MLPVPGVRSNSPTVAVRPCSAMGWIAARAPLQAPLEGLQLEWVGWARGLGWLLPWELVPKVRAGAQCHKSTGNVLTAFYSVDKQRAEGSGVVNLSPFSSTKLIFLSV